MKGKGGNVPHGTFNQQLLDELPIYFLAKGIRVWYKILGCCVRDA